ncbi:MAG: thiamine pyrophosphate-binding protein, partial [Xanthobacteraceae bacterium]
MKKGSDLLVAALENEGVDRIFGVPGEENLDVVESLRTSRIELVLTRHEQPAAFMAATHGRLTGKPGVCMSTLGPGALNFATGAAYAHLGAMPMILITGQKPILTSRQARFQMVDVVASMR